MLEYLEIIEDNLIDMFSKPTIITKIINANCKGYVRDKLKKELNSGDTCRVFLILLNLKGKKTHKNPQETIAEKVKLMSRKKKQDQESKSELQTNY